MTGEARLDGGKYGQIAFRTHENRKISQSDRCGESSVPSTVVRGYDLHKLEVIWELSAAFKAKKAFEKFEP